MPEKSKHDLDKITEFQQPTGSDEVVQRENEAVYAEHKRKQGVKNVLHKIFINFLWVISWLSIAVISVRVVTLVLPTRWQWLTNEQIQGIDKLFFSGAVGGFVVTYFKKFND